MARKYTSLTSDAIAIDRELDTTGYDTVKAVADELTNLAVITANMTEILLADDSAAAALASKNAAAADLVLTNADVVITNQDAIDSAASEAVATAQAAIALAQANISLTQAGLATDNAGYALEWAIKAEDVLISVAAGGNGTTDYSALHWSAKAAVFAGAGTGIFAIPVTIDPSTDVVALNIQQDFGNVGLNIDLQAALAFGIIVTDNGLGTGNPELILHADNTNRTAAVQQTIQNHISATAVANYILQNGPNAGLYINNGGSAGPSIELFGGNSNIVIEGVTQPKIAAPVTGHIRAGNTQLLDGSSVAGAAFITISSIVAKGVWESIGPAAFAARSQAAADNLWADMDNLPLNATVLICDIILRPTSNSMGQGNITVHTASGDVVASVAGDDSYLINIGLDANDTNTNVLSGSRVFIPIGPTNSDFQINWTDNSVSSSLIELYYRGFMTD